MCSTYEEARIEYTSRVTSKFVMTTMIVISSLHDFSAKGVAATRMAITPGT